MASLKDLVKAFARKLLTENKSLITAREWIARKRKANMLLAFFGGEPEAWTPEELSLMDERRS